MPGNRDRGDMHVPRKKAVMIKASCRLWGEEKLGHIFIKVTTGAMDVCVQWDRDRPVAIIHPVAAENDGFIGYLSSRKAFGEDTISERGVYAYI